MLSFASKVSTAEGAFSSLGPLGKTISLFVNSSLYDNVPTRNLKLSGITIDHIYQKDHTTQDFSGYIPMVGRQRHINDVNNIITYEDPGKFDLAALSAMNTYRFRYKNNIKVLFDTLKDGNTSKVKYVTMDATPSLFNPQYGVQTCGISPRTPLINDLISSNPMTDDSPYDCSIRKLCSDSLKVNGPLGVSTYRLVDFLYCKDLGKVSNNRLVTLRRFAFPIGDHIGKYATPKYADDIYTYDTPGDVGRLVSWFDTDDNKLEDICKYDMKMSWKQIDNKIQEVDSKEDSSERGLIGMLNNTINPRYNSFQENYGGTNQNIMAFLGGKMHLKTINQNNNEVLRMSANNNKVYTPKNTVQDTHLYEGKLTLNQEITLNFSYKLRAYDNINPKSAFLDLMGNILNVTYRRGSYWAGEHRLVGPPRNQSAWAKTNALIDNAWHKLGGFIEAIATGTQDFNSIIGSIANALGYINSALNKVEDGVEKIVQLGPKEIAKSSAKAVMDLNNAVGLSHYLKGMLKDQLGRPALYALDSLISGDDCGFWHLTIGNPYNPIMSIGNLIMTNATVQHFGPLGVDDFPSEIKVTVTVKPGRSRDLTEIARYYTQGTNTIYLSKVSGKQSNYHNFSQQGVDSKGNVIYNESPEDAEDMTDRDSNQRRQANISGMENLSAGGGQNMNQIEKNGTNVNDDSVAEKYHSQKTREMRDWVDTNNTMYLQDGMSGLLYATNNYDVMYHIRSYDEIDYA